MNTFLGKCKYCGDTRSIFAESQEEADREISQSCSCKGAETEAKKESVSTALSELAGELAPNAGFTPVKPDIFRDIEALMLHTVTGEIRAATVKVDGTTLTAVNSNGKIRVNRKKSYEEGRNIE